jgi:hypothetical protein
LYASHDCDDGKSRQHADRREDATPDDELESVRQTKERSIRQERRPVLDVHEHCDGQDR